MDPNSDVPVTRAKAFGSSITVLTQFMPPAPVPVAGQSMEGLMPTLTLLSDSERGYLAAAATCIQPKAPADDEAAEEDASELGSSAALPPKPLPILTHHRLYSLATTTVPPSPTGVVNLYHVVASGGGSLRHVATVKTKAPVRKLELAQDGRCA